MRINVNKLLVFLLVFVLSFGSVGESTTVNAADDTELSGEIEVIFNRSDEDMQPYIDAFMQKYPNVTVTYTCYNNLEEELKARIETGDYGDVTYFPSFIPTENASEYFESLGTHDALFSKYNYLNHGRFYDGNVYAIPSSAYLVGMVYNKEVFEKAGISTLPKTLDEFMEDMRLIKEHTDAIPFFAGYSEPWVLANWELFPYIEMTGKASYKYNEFLLDQNPFREGTVHNTTYRFLYDLVANGYTEVGNEKNKENNFAWWDSVVGINSGDVACAVTGTWALCEYKKVGPNSDDIGFMPFPNNIDGKQYVTVTGDYGYAIPKTSKNKKAAKAFVTFMLDESGFAFDHDTLSPLKSDPYPEIYSSMDFVPVLNSAYVSQKANTLYYILADAVKLYNQDEYIRIVKAAGGFSNESFNEIMEDWNTKWEEARENSGISLDDDNDSTDENTIVEFKNSKVDFSRNEAGYIADTKTLIVGYHKNMAPLSYEENGKFVGLANDVCEYISQKTGIEFEYRGYSNSKELIGALNSGEINFIAGIEKEEEKEVLRYSKEYLEYMNVILRHNTVDASSFNRYCIVEGENYEEFANVKQILNESTINESIAKVENLNADFTITNYHSANYYIRSAGYKEITIIPYTKGKTYNIGFSDKASPTLVAIINKCIYSLPEGESEIFLMKHMDNVVTKVTLTTFIRANPIKSIVAIILVFLLILIIVYEEYKAEKRRLIEAQKYEMLSSLAQESIFEYDYKKEQYIFDSKFSNATKIDKKISLASYNGDNEIFNQFRQQIKDEIIERKSINKNIELVKSDGEKMWYKIIASSIFDKKNQPVHLIGKIVNIQKEMEAVTTYQDKAYKDPLTKLFNRDGLIKHIPNNAKDVMLTMIDMDDFKAVNDTLGHGGGDYALMYLADKLEEFLGSNALIARYGGDEFVAVLIGVSEQEAQKRLEELVNAMDVNIRYAGNTRKISISAGAVYTDFMNSFDELFDKADKVLYKVKEEGKCNYQLIKDC